jgi:hypothetical protein
MINPTKDCCVNHDVSCFVFSYSHLVLADIMVHTTVFSRVNHVAWSFPLTSWFTQQFLVGLIMLLGLSC